MVTFINMKIKSKTGEIHIHSFDLQTFKWLPLCWDDVTAGGVSFKQRGAGSSGHEASSQTSDSVFAAGR